MSRRDDTEIVTGLIALVIMAAIFFGYGAFFYLLWKLGWALVAWLGAHSG